MSLRERAAANGADATPARAALSAAPAESDELPEIEYDDPIADAEKVATHTAWARVMADVKSVAKAGRATITMEKGGSYSFSYRGIDQVLNAVGPALRRHGVMVIPRAVEASYGNSGRMREVQVNVTYAIIGPDGTSIPAQSVGEGLDMGERGTTKALTNAYRNLLIAALTLPTLNDKLDPDKVNLERPDTRPKAVDYRDEAVHPATSLARLRTMHGEVRRHGMADVLVVNDTGDDEPLGALIQRIGEERKSGGAQ